MVFLVFTLGLEFSLPRLVAMGGAALVVGAQVLATAAIVALVAVDSFGVAIPAGIVRLLRQDVPILILVRTPDDTLLSELQRAGATKVVPETFEASLMLLSHVPLLKVPVSRVERTVDEIRSERYGMLRQFFPATAATPSDETHSFREEPQRDPAAACLGRWPQHCRADRVRLQGVHRLAAPRRRATRS